LSKGNIGDIIINRFPLIQNAAAIKLPKKTNDLIRLSIQQAENSFKAYLQTEKKSQIEDNERMQWFNYIHPKGKFAGFADVIGVQLIREMQNQAITALRTYLAQDTADADTVFAMILSRDKTSWHTQEDQQYMPQLLTYIKNM
jgi:hypothetical protein